MDLYIKIPDQYHIIIENKIFGAKEQKDQMKRYIDEINEIKNVTVLAFYATSDGREKCQTAGKYDDKVIPLAFYSDNHEEQTIYKVLSRFKHDTLAQDFCFYLSYIFGFFTLYSVSFLQNCINEIDLFSQDCFEELFKGDYPIISKKINPYTDNPKEYFMQLLKVHALNCYLLKVFGIKEFEKDNCYHAVFDGIRVKRQAKIGNRVYFETKYYYNRFYMVITICSLNKIKRKIMGLLKNYKGNSDYFYLYTKQNKLNKEFTYSLWLWIMDPKEIKNNKEKCNSYEDYINFLFTNRMNMKEIFDAITK